MRVAPLTEADARTICAWRYEPPYDAYDMPSWAVVARDGWAIAVPSRRAEQFRAVSDEAGLVGFSRLVDRDEHLVLGVGMAPERTGGGLGAAFVGVVLADSAARFPGRVLELDVLDFNTRAIRCYERCGFVAIGVRDDVVLDEHVRMVRMVRRLEGPAPGR